MSPDATPTFDRSAGSERSGPAKAGLLLGCWSVILGAVLACGWLITHRLTGSVGEVDGDLARWLADRRTATLSDVADIGRLCGDTLICDCVAVAVAVGSAIWKRSWLPALFMVVVGIGVYGIYLPAVTLVHRQRPPVPILDPGLVPDHSFPSGHVGTAIMLYGGIVVLTWTYAGAARWWVTPLLLLPLFVLVSRLYQGAHYLSDALTSLAFASAWLVVVSRVLLRGQSTAASRGR